MACSSTCPASAFWLRKRLRSPNGFSGPCKGMVMSEYLMFTFICVSVGRVTNDVWWRGSCHIQHGYNKVQLVCICARTSARTCGAASIVTLVDGSSRRAFFATGRAERPKASVVGGAGPLSSSEEYPATRDMVARVDEWLNEDCYVISCRPL